MPKRFPELAKLSPWEWPRHLALTCHNALLGTYMTESQQLEIHVMETNSDASGNVRLFDQYKTLC